MAPPRPGCEKTVRSTSLRPEGALQGSATNKLTLCAMGRLILDTLRTPVEGTESTTSVGDLVQEAEVGILAVNSPRFTCRPRTSV